jgi:hypothetical protein
MSTPPRVRTTRCAQGKVELVSATQLGYVDVGQDCGLNLHARSVLRAIKDAQAACATACPKPGAPEAHADVLAGHWLSHAWRCPHLLFRIRVHVRDGPQEVHLLGGDQAWRIQGCVLTMHHQRRTSTVSDSNCLRTVVVRAKGQPVLAWHEGFRLTICHVWHCDTLWDTCHGCQGTPSPSRGRTTYLHITSVRPQATVRTIARLASGAHIRHPWLLPWSLCSHGSWVCATSV